VEDLLIEEYYVRISSLAVVLCVTCIIGGWSFKTIIALMLNRKIGKFRLCFGVQRTIDYQGHLVCS
jgi:hypothetical protein